MTRAMLVFWITLLVVAILSGVLAHNVWVSVLSGTGLIVLTDGFRLLNRQVARKDSGLFLVKMFAGLSLLGGATWLAQLEGRWIWTAVWLLAALPILVAGNAMFRKVAIWRVVLTLALSGAAALFAIVSPFLAEGDFWSQGFLGWLLLWLFLLLGPVLVLTVRYFGERDVRVIRLAFILLLGVAIIAGFATRNSLVPFLILAGLLLIYRSEVRVREGLLFQYRRYLPEALVGVALLAVATALDRLQTWWLWSPVWMLAGVPLLTMGAALYSGNPQSEEWSQDLVPRGMVRTGTVMLVLGALCFLLALVGPFVLAQLEALPALVTSVLVAAGFLLVFLAWSEAGANRAGRSAALGIGGTLLWGAGSLYCSFAGIWVWTVLWLGGAALLAAAARALSSRVATLFVAGLALLHFLVAFLVPTFRLEYLATVAAVGIFAAIALAGLGLYRLSLTFRVEEAARRGKMVGGILRPEMMDAVIKHMMKAEEEEHRSG